MHQAVRKLAGGAELQVITTDPAALRDVPQFCRFLGHALLHVDTCGDETLFRIKVKS
jgi:tRNA 2-thiouridine synthesizing protein A